MVHTFIAQADKREIRIRGIPNVMSLGKLHFNVTFVVIEVKSGSLAIPG